MWIETEIKGTFTTKKGDQMVSFTAKREDGRNWAAPLWLVSRGVGGNADAGLAVRINVDGERVNSVQRNRHQTVGTSSTVSASVTAEVSTSLPYGFVPINLDHAIRDAPVWHDGSCGGELLSGEILCELEALTPLLPGNMRYDIEKADSGKLGIDYFEDLPKKKQVAEPLRLPDGRVVIAGSAIKGMFRQSLGALTAAPMERVAEHHYSYRPNLGHPGPHAWLKCRPAVITSVAADRVDVLVLPAQSAIFVHSNSARAALSAYSFGNLVNTTLVDSVLDIDPTTHQKRIRINTASTLPLNHYLYSYAGGIDGTGVLATAFAGGTKRVHKEVLVPAADVTSGIARTISTDVLKHYQLTQQVLADSHNGHLSNAHPLTKNLTPSGVQKAQDGIEAATRLNVDQLIYVEIAVNSGTLGEIQSFGHNYQYRWAYTSSVRTRDGTRACLSPMSCERPPEEADARKDIPPERLTGARLLFGYVHDPETNRIEGKTRIGKGVYERLAGRIAINHAISDGVPGCNGVPDFLGKETGYCLPLKILGQPKPSAWEFYLQQPQDENKPLVTYGDLPNDAGGELAGRKFYRHQTSVSLTPEDIKSDQATLARFICAPQTRFKFAIRFMRLRDWELGALLAVLEPHLLVPGSYAHKLGLGRPLGMGSVRITRKKIRLRLEKDVHFLDEKDEVIRIKLALQELQKKLDPEIMKNWLEAHELLDGKHLGYPVAWTRVDGQPVQTIYAWHTKLRREYSKLRREEGANWSQLFSTIRKAKADTP